MDNFIALGTQRRPVLSATQLVESALNKAGQPTHGATTTQGGETLGWQIDSELPIIGINPRSAWRIRLGLKELIRLGWASGDTVRIVVSHFTYRALLRRELLCCFSAAYAFIQSAGSHRCKLWPSVLRELQWASSLI